MKSVTLKIPDYLDAKLRLVLARRKESFSQLARRVFAREVEEHETDFARLAEPYRGMFKGKRDLSTREGYGTKPRELSRRLKHISAGRKFSRGELNER